MNQHAPILVLDLDETLIKTHYSEYPFVQYYECHKNYRGKFSAGNGWYYIFHRPFLENFLKNCENLFDIYIYSNGTQSYVEEVLKTFPRKPFKKVIGRKSCNDTLIKTLDILPIENNPAIIVDDRVDVWDDKHKSHVIQIPVFKAYEFHDKHLENVLSEIQDKYIGIVSQKLLHFNLTKN